MPEQAMTAAYAVHEKRIRDAVALQTPDRVPLALNGPAWPARSLGVPMTEVATTPERSYEVIIEAIRAWATSTASRALPMT